METIRHIIEKVIKLILNIKNSQSDIPQQNNKSECLILQHQHQKDRQANNKNERRYTNQQKNIINKLSSPLLPLSD